MATEPARKHNRPDATLQALVRIEKRLAELTTLFREMTKDGALLVIVQNAADVGL